MYLLLQTTFQPQIKLKFLLCHVVLIIHPAYLQIKHTNSNHPPVGGMCASTCDPVVLTARWALNTDSV